MDEAFNWATLVLAITAPAIAWWIYRRSGARSFVWLALGFTWGMFVRTVISFDIDPLAEHTRALTFVTYLGFNAGLIGIAVGLEAIRRKNGEDK
jgi:hypothetical protein